MFVDVDLPQFLVQMFGACINTVCLGSVDRRYEARRAPYSSSAMWPMFWFCRCLETPVWFHWQMFGNSPAV